MLPSCFLKKFMQKQTSCKSSSCLYTYDRDIICLPQECCKSNIIHIPRNREGLSKDGLIGRIRLTSEMSEDEIFDEIRSVFRIPMAGTDHFSFDVLQSAGGQSKTLVVPALSSSYKWTASALAPKNVKTPIYILAREPFKVHKP